MIALCRDCLACGPSAGARCSACGSPRIVRHAELMKLAVAHVDCDAFFASVEKRDRPELRDRPVIVGGGRRGVVSAACYVARISGVRSAMPMFRALALCPDAVVIRPDGEKYSRVGREIRAMMRDLTPLVEPLSIDEAFLDLSGTELVHGRAPAAALAAFALQVEREVGVTVSIGLSHNKFLAKIASDLDKPRGYSVIGRAETADFLADQPVSIIWGVGRTLERRLAADGVRTLADLRALGLKRLAERYGTFGTRLFDLAHGLDQRAVSPDRETKSVSAETTFNEDLSDFAALRPILWRLCEKVSARLKRQDLSGRTVTLKLKSAEFRLRTRNRRLVDPTRLADRLYETAQDLLAKEIDGTRYRLLGVGLSDLEAGAAADPRDLIDMARQKRAQAETAMDDLRRRFGKGAVERGIAFGGGRRPDPLPQDEG